MDFLSERIPSCDEEHSDTNTTKMVNEERNIHDPIEEMEKYIHTVLDSDDEEAKKCKLEHNTLLFLPFQGERSLASSTPFEWRPKQSLILQRVQKTANFLLKICQENINTEHKSYTKKTAHVCTAT